MSIIPRKEANCLPNSKEITKTLEWSFVPGQTFEVRTLESQTKPWARTSSGYFRDVTTAVQAILNHIEEYNPSQVYCTLNPVKPDVYARCRDRIQPNAKNTTKDTEIAHIQSVLVDCDPVRPAGIPATDTELHAAENTMNEVKEWLDEHGFPSPLIALSGRHRQTESGGTLSPWLPSQTWSRPAW